MFTVSTVLVQWVFMGVGKFSTVTSTVREGEFSAADSIVMFSNRGSSSLNTLAHLAEYGIQLSLHAYRYLSIHEDTLNSIHA